MQNSLHFKGQILHRCRLPCCALGHYHCPLCSRTVLPDDILQRILVLVVLEDGCSAIFRLALTCQRFNHIVSQDHFKQEAHFSWLDSVVNWKRFSEGHRQSYIKPYTLHRHLQCSQLYKDCGAGYKGNGQRGVLLGFYSSDDHPGYCSWDCFIDDGGLEQ